MCFNVKQEVEMFLRLSWATSGSQTYFHPSDRRERNLSLEKARGVSTLGQLSAPLQGWFGEEGIPR